MTLFIISLGIFLIAFAGQAIGVLCGGKSITGSCGGIFKMNCFVCKRKKQDGGRSET